MKEADRSSLARTCRKVHQPRIPEAFVQLFLLRSFRTPRTVQYAEYPKDRKPPFEIITALSVISKDHPLNETKKLESLAKYVAFLHVISVDVIANVIK